MKFHVVTGLPRSGSTLLCNILNQNPKFHASSTSTLNTMLSVLSKSMSDSIEVKADLDRDKEETEKRVKKSVLAFMDAWYSGTGAEVTFDKSRAWAASALMLRDLKPDSVMLVMIRDLRNVFASIEKQHRNNPILDDAANPLAKTIYNRADRMFSPQGLIGAPIVGIEDLIRRKIPNVLFVTYERLSTSPDEVISQIYTTIGEPKHEHNFKCVENTATDPDGLYLQKFPHKGEGEVKPGNPDEWRQFFTEELAAIIMGKFNFFNTQFGYR